MYVTSENKFYKGIIRNLSHGGAYIETKTEFSSEDEIKLVLPGPNKFIHIRCNIIHKKKTGFGVKFKSVLKINKFSNYKNSSS